ncbi:MAG TPA: ABC transporter permease, partial [Burkholderiaceae bacterium]
MWTIYLKEILELARDRKTLIFTVFIPIMVIPLLGGGFGYMSYAMNRDALQANLPYAAFGAEHAPSLLKRFADDASFKQVPLDSPADINGAINAGKIKFALVIPPAQADVAQPRKLALHYNTATSVDVVGKRVRAIVDAENKVLREAALPALRLSQAQLDYLISPVTIDRISSADRREQVGEIVGRILPYILLIV